MGILVITVDLQCCRCKAKIKKVLCCLEEEYCIEKVEYEDKEDRVIVRGKFDAEKLRMSIWCKACKVVKDIVIVKVWPPEPPPPPPPPPPKPVCKMVPCLYPVPYPMMCQSSPWCCPPPQQCHCCSKPPKPPTPPPSPPKPKPCECEHQHCKPAPPCSCGSRPPTCPPTCPPTWPPAVVCPPTWPPAVVCTEDSNSCSIM